MLSRVNAQFFSSVIFPGKSTVIAIKVVRQFYLVRAMDSFLALMWAVGIGIVIETALLLKRMSTKKFQ